MSFFRLQLLAYFMLGFQFGYAQNSLSTFDSIISVSKKESNDSLQINYLQNVFFEYSYSKPEIAKSIANESLRLSLKNENNYFTIRALLRKGIYYDIVSKNDSALLTYDRAYKIAVKTNDQKAIASVYNNKGLIYWKNEEYADAMSMYLESLKIFENLKQERGQANNLNNIGLLLAKLNRIDESNTYYRKCLSKRKKIDDTYGIAAVYSNMSANFSKQKQIDSSIYYTRKAIAIKSNINDKRGLGIAYNNLGLEFKQIAQRDSALLYLTKADKIYKSLKTNKLRASNLYEKGKILQNIKQYNKAITCYQIALKNLNDSEQSTRLKLLRNMSKSYYNLGDYKLASSLSLAALVIQDSISYKQDKVATNDLFEKYQSTKKEKEILSQRTEIAEQNLLIQNRNYQIYALISLGLLLGLVGVSIYKQQTAKNKLLKKESALKESLAKERTHSRLQDQRLRISRDLHDNIGSQLTFIISSIENLHFLSKNSDKIFKNKLSQITSFAKDTITQLRDTIWAMNQDEISFENFQSRILSFIEKAKMSNEKIAISLHTDGDISISFTSAKGINLYRVVQEAINNALKYAKAKSILVHVKQIGQKIEICIADDGKGFDITTVELGNGIENMQRRIEELGGIFKLKSTLKQGTIITVTCNKDTLNVV